jgi:hypothetical protein
MRSSTSICTDAALKDLHTRKYSLFSRSWLRPQGEEEEIAGTDGPTVCLAFETWQGRFVSER